MRASYGTLQLLGLKPGGFPFSPRTAFFLIGEECSGNCAFCAQSAGQSDKLSRITWPEIDPNEAIEKLAFIQLDRICIQAVKSHPAFREACEFLPKIKKANSAPISASMHIENLAQTELLFDLGCDSVSVALDCSTEELSRVYKGRDLSSSFNLLQELATKWPGKVATHLIMGLGETEEELVKLARKIIKAGASISLFAFTPIEGTLLENNTPPEPKRYRMVQVALALIRKNQDINLHYQNGKLVFEVLPRQLLEPEDFQNPGCSGCNRPYYNERPGGFMYNYPNPPDLDEALSVLEEQ
ncbi:MAG TPA: radical SAM protein [Caldisericia bacterium]|nr:radical SAM protein [Caldisericia bacterium]HOU08727.1 radical SAM protein [Caldisericia bacterium]HPL89667.1 radical SAM protein [Caldisericia bacterium]HQG59605.1 radical SAM protein [Caldisericia bacterium]HQH49228.1 radical SAM protein [Caldisericia bacterium]